MDRGTWRLQSVRLHRVGHDWATEHEQEQPGIISCSDRVLPWGPLNLLTLNKGCEFILFVQSVYIFLISQSFFAYFSTTILLSVRCCVQPLSRVWLFVTPWIAARQFSLSFTITWSVLRLLSSESVMPSKHLILCHPLLLLPSVFPNIRVFSNKSVFHIWWPKYWSFSFSISPSSEYSGLISFRNDWLDLLAVQGTLKNLLQQHNSKPSFLWHSAFFMVNPHLFTWLLKKPYMDVCWQSEVSPF